MRVKQVTAKDSATAEVVADIETAFRIEQNADGHWTVREVRLAPDRWESVDTISQALGATGSRERCAILEQMDRRMSVPHERRARCLLAELLGVELPSDAVRIKSISALGLPFASASSATVVAVLRLNFQLAREKGNSWRVVQVGSGDRGWADIAQIQSAVDALKRQSAMADMQTVATAVEKFRSARGFYVTTDEHSILIDHLAPRYLQRIIRLDPWNRPYAYQGDGNRFTLRSNGPDGKENTADDIVLSRP